jgi:type IV secretory pathway VirB2 component (pilin)
MTAGTKPSEVPMRITLTSPARRRISRWKFPRRFPKTLPFVTLTLLVPAVAFAQSGSPFDTGFTALQNLFTGTVAKVASLIAIVIGGYEFAHGEPGAKKTLAGVAAGSGIAVLAVNVLNWLWGI